jgi:hypothetical protein
MKNDLRQIGEIMKDMGFNKNSSQGTQAAFIKHLIKKAYGVDVELPKFLAPELESSKSGASIGEQLELPLSDKKGA